jgi:uncharacterized protein (TIGR00369 family)
MSPQFAPIPADALKSLSGLDVLRGMMEGRFPAPPISDTMGFTLDSVDHGRAVFSCTPAFKHYNPIGSVHGGLAGTLLDSCMGCAVHTTLAAGTGYTTLEYSVHLVRGLTDKTGKIFAEGKVIHVGKRMATAEGRITDANGVLYAHGTTTCMLFPMP